jgi:hypothetical protein
MELTRGSLGGYEFERIVVLFSMVLEERAARKFLAMEIRRRSARYHFA